MKLKILIKHPLKEITDLEGRDQAKTNFFLLQFFFNFRE